MEVTTVLELVNWTFVGIVVLGYELLKQLIPVVKEIKQVIGILVFSALVGVGFYFLEDGITFGTTLLSFLASIALYDIIVKPIKDLASWNK